MRAHVVVWAGEAFWELICVFCGLLVIESLHYAETDCERCGTIVKVDLGGGAA